MTTEEIEKAVEEYAESLKSIEPKTLIGRAMPYALRGAFKEGLDFTNKHWQEETRWRSLLIEHPKFPSNPSEERQVLVRHAKGGYDVRFLVKQSSIDYWLREGFIFWKEIE